MENLSACHSKDLKKKRKNKKKKKSGSSRTKFSSDLDNENDEIDEITRTVRLVDKMFGTTSQQQENHRPEVDPKEHSSAGVLHIQHKNLNPQTEIKRMFGKVVNQEQQKKRRAGSNRVLRAVVMTNPKDNWPPITRTGLSMNLVAAPEGETLGGGDKNKNLLHFAFEHSQTYRAIQKKFLESVESFESDNIVRIINMQPYHIDVSINCNNMTHCITKLFSLSGFDSNVRSLQDIGGRPDGGRTD